MTVFVYDSILGIHISIYGSLNKRIHLVEVVDGDNILGSLLVVGNTGVLKTVTPQDLVG